MPKKSEDSSNLIENTLFSKMLYQGNIINLRLDKIQLPNGKVSTREIIEHPGAVAIIAFTADEELLMVKQYRKAIDKVTLEIPAGKLDKGEKPLDCAQRELEEETGYKGEIFQKLFHFFTTPGFSDEVMYLYLAKNLYQGQQNLDTDEFINVEKIKIDQAINLIKNGTIEDAKTIIALLFLLAAEKF